MKQATNCKTESKFKKNILKNIKRWQNWSNMSKEIFKKRREIIYHVKTKHEEEQRNGDLSGLFPCEICRTAFYSKFILRTHKKANMKSSEAGCDKY